MFQPVLRLCSHKDLIGCVGFWQQSLWVFMQVIIVYHPTCTAFEPVLRVLFCAQFTWWINTCTTKKNTRVCVNTQSLMLFIRYGRDSVWNRRWKERRTSARLHGSRGASACGTVREGRTCWTAARPFTTPTKLQMGSTWPSELSSRSSTGSCSKVRNRQNASDWLNGSRELQSDNIVLCVPVNAEVREARAQTRTNVCPKTWPALKTRKLR